MKTSSFEKARDYAFLLLKFRPRSEKELYQRLKKKRFDDGIIRETLAFLKEKGFVNDTNFSRAWIESRLKKPLGLRKIKQELRQKGITKEIIDRQLQDLKKNYFEEEIVRRVAQARMGRLKDIDPRKVKSRIYAYLLRRGFSPDIVIDVINQLCNRQTS